MSDALDDGPFFHGTKADLGVGDLLTAGFRSNYRPEVVMNHVYFTALPDGAGLAAELAPGSDELLSWSGLARAQAGDLEGGVAAVRRAVEENPNWLVLLERLSPEFAPAGEAVRRALG